MQCLTPPKDGSEWDGLHRSPLRVSDLPSLLHTKARRSLPREPRIPAGLVQNPPDSAGHAQVGVLEVVAGVELEGALDTVGAKKVPRLLRSRANVAHESVGRLVLLAPQREICAFGPGDGLLTPRKADPALVP